MQIAPSILTADFCEIGELMDELISNDIDWIHLDVMDGNWVINKTCLLYTSPSPRDATLSRMPSSA